MNRFKLSLLALIASLSVSTMGASIDHIQNYSAEYGGNPAQQGAINVGSTVYFNPAGLMRLENGTYIVGGIQYAFGDQNMSSDGRDFSTNLSSPIPNFALYKKTDDGAYFWTMGGVAGGAELGYKDSIPLNVSGIDFNNFLSTAEIKGSNMYAQTTLGKAFDLTNKWSASLAVRGVYGKRTLKANAHVAKNVNIGDLIGKPLPLPIFREGDASIDSEREAYGFGGQFGLNYAPNDRLNIGFRYDTKVKLKFKTKSDINDNTYGQAVNIGPIKIPSIGISDALLGLYPVYKDGEKIRRDLPAIAALGASYKVTDQWTTFIGGNYYFNESATMDRVGKTSVDYKNGWEISVGSEYWFTPQIAWLVGFNYADTGAPDKSFAATEYALNSTMLGTGVKYKPNETVEWTVAFNHYIYDTRTISDIKYEKEISSIGINFVKKF
ncbi:MAG: OmpP1/FadL family transporter [Cetobacterium somerae]|uniref:OmpP1/FadL family transporter n=1 Tax=Cetobacterium TaxID=180162 RepID=UPI00163CB07A|nr:MULTISPECIES: outer membrane protein transport protein [Cetobacterium]MBC2853789.1 outer membrane protein transport protein [Cetobacterium sp. 2G large]MCQ9625648.1 outer membrane protein transport protein [Cetobacterium somerae]